ncbi:hypothetical protein SEPCBS119000_006590 [Sporothrix epigloea]|uniref:F-box domain-containing protein n=1 Tax=Sporothrix epigloea TaxID=1892477 RepID=A0ABP0E6C7_9PEZI
MAVVHGGPSFAMGQDYLSRLPVELLLRITRHFETADLCAFRLCSRTLERALHYFFMDEFFRSKQFMLTEFSLQTLLDMARHPVISQTLRHVSIGLEDFLVYRQHHPTNTKLAAFLITAVVEQKALMTNGSAVRLLATAFSLLPNLETVQLRDYDSYTPYRGRPFEALRSHGLWRLREHFGWRSKKMMRITCSPIFSTQAFAIVMMALAQSNARPSNLEVSSKHRNGIHYFALDLAPMPRLDLHGGGGDGGGEDKVHVFQVLAGLRRLHLHLRFGFLSAVADDFGISDYLPHRDYTHPASVDCLPLCVWLAHCPKLEWLRLNLENETDVDNNIVLGQLGVPLPDFYPFPPGSEASRDITLPFASHLRRLDLGRACCYQSVLFSVLHRLPALEHLSLWRSTLVTKDCHPHGTWEDFLEALAGDRLGKQLEKLSLKRLFALTKPAMNMYMQNSYIITWNGQKGIEYEAGAEVSMASWQRKVLIYYERDRGQADFDSDTDSVESTQNDDNGSDVHEYESEDEHEQTESGEETWSG